MNLISYWRYFQTNPTDLNRHDKKPEEVRTEISHEDGTVFAKVFYEDTSFSVRCKTDRVGSVSVEAAKDTGDYVKMDGLADLRTWIAHQ